MAIEILKQMADGKVLKTSDGYTVGMAENGFVGFVIEGKVSLFSEVSFGDLVQMCDEDNIIVIPESGRCSATKGNLSNKPKQAKIRNENVIKEILDRINRRPVDRYYVTLANWPESRHSEIMHHAMLLFDEGCIDGILYPNKEFTAKHLTEVGELLLKKLKDK
jgi:hypothetical protein